MAVDVPRLLSPYSPWHADQESWGRLEKTIPTFKRPVFARLVSDLDSISQIMSITGPRRIGKTTLLRQLVQLLLSRGVSAQRIVYYSFDDPLIFRQQLDGEDILESVIKHICRDPNEKTYLFLDEIQRLDRWELYLKKYYDLDYPLRIVISGSASSPIFKKSRESLLGRIKDYHLLPFAFSELLLFLSKDDDELTKEILAYEATGHELIGMFSQTPKHSKVNNVLINWPSDKLWAAAQDALGKYMVYGGFPEVLNLKTDEQRIEYLFDNQVNKVISEDLVLAVELRKPEQLKAFYISLIEQPGREVNLTKLSGELGINIQQIEKYMPLLEMTDLLKHASKFRPSPVRVRQGFRKYYLVDLGLRNAVLRLGHDLLNDPTMLGLYAENLVFNSINTRPVLQVDYYREGNHEVDFIVHFGPSRHWPIEVKYRNKWSASELSGLLRFVRKQRSHTPMIVTKHREDRGMMKIEGVDVFRMPLIVFLLLFQ